MHENLKSQQLVVLLNHGILQRHDLLYFYIVYCILTYMSSLHYIKHRNIIQQKEILQKTKKTISGSSSMEGLRLMYSTKQRQLLISNFE